MADTTMVMRLSLIYRAEAKSALPAPQLLRISKVYKLIVEGGPVMYPLLVCSFVSLTLIIERLIFWLRETRFQNTELRKQILQRIESGNFQQAESLGTNSRDYIVRCMLNAIPHHHLSLEDAVQVVSNRELKRMKKYLNPLDTIVTLAPLLGILGTVIGIILTFDVLGNSGIQDPQAVTSGIAQALVTTAAGLAIAIVTLIPYNYFQSKVEDATTELERFLTHFEMAYKKSRLAENDESTKNENQTIYS